MNTDVRALKLLMDEKGMTPKKLANAAGVTEGLVQAMLNGKKMWQTDINKVAKALGTDAEGLKAWEGKWLISLSPNGKPYECRCTACTKTFYFPLIHRHPYKYCPECGAVMTGTIHERTAV